jgi:hypothetical protein
MLEPVNGLSAGTEWPSLGGSVGFTFVCCPHNLSNSLKRTSWASFPRTAGVSAGLLSPPLN